MIPSVELLSNCAYLLVCRNISVSTGNHGNRYVAVRHGGSCCSSIHGDSSTVASDTKEQRSEDRRRNSAVPRTVQHV